MSYIRENFRVVVGVDIIGVWARNAKEKERILENRAAQIKGEIMRHVDGFDQVSIDADHVCEHCGYAWEQPPGCCDKAVAEWDAAQPKAETTP